MRMRPSWLSKFGRRWASGLTFYKAVSSDSLTFDKGVLSVALTFYKGVSYGRAGAEPALCGRRATIVVHTNEGVPPAALTSSLQSIGPNEGGEPYSFDFRLSWLASMKALISSAIESRRSHCSLYSVTGKRPIP
jgi:hypothetical protein